MRLFIAIDLDDNARAAIAEEQRRLKTAMSESGSSMKWVRAEQMHLTLVFLGEVPEPSAPPIVDALNRPVDQSPFELVFSGIGVFPPHGAPNVLWIGAAAGADDSIELQRHLADRVRALGLAVERRPFHPHLTLARWKTSRGADRARARAAAHDRMVAAVHVGHATLYRSRLSSAGPSYTPLARATLTPRG